MSAALIIVCILAVGATFFGGYLFLHYWLEIRPFQKKFKRRGVEDPLRSDENENLVAPSRPTVLLSVLNDTEGHPLIADVERRRARAAAKLSDEEVEDISPPESVGDFRRGASVRSTGSRCSGDSGSAETPGGGEKDAIPDRSSPSVLYPSIRAVRKIDEPDRSDDALLENSEPVVVEAPAPVHGQVECAEEVNRPVIRQQQLLVQASSSKPTVLSKVERGASATVGWNVDDGGMIRSGGSKSCLIPTVSYDGEPDVMSSSSLLHLPFLSSSSAAASSSSVDFASTGSAERGDPEGQELVPPAPVSETAAGGLEDGEMTPKFDGSSRMPQNVGEIVLMMQTMLDGIDRDLQSLEDDFVSGKLDASLIASSSSPSQSPPLSSDGHDHDDGHCEEEDGGDSGEKTAGVKTSPRQHDSSTDSSEYDPHLHDTATLRIVKKKKEADDGAPDVPAVTETSM